MGRREAREKLFGLVFEMSFKEQNELEGVIERADEENILDDYIRSSLIGIYEKLGEIDLRISDTSKDWKVERISRISVSAMRIAVYEMLYASLPYQVAINEAVIIVKKYDDDNAHVFVNGVLNKIADKEGLKG